MSRDHRSLLVMRHGQSITNTGTATGNETNLLTGKGLAQAVRAGEMLHRYQFSKVFTSLYPRAIQTAMTVLSASEHLPVEMVRMPELQERTYGFERYMHWTEMHAIYGKDLVDLSDSDVHHSFDPDVETQHSVYLRVTRALADVVVPALEHGDVLLVAHFYVMRAIQSFVEGGSSDLMPYIFPDNAMPVKYGAEVLKRRINKSQP